ncbi:MAG TPA: GerMN domain-containing protein [Candidatus Paceibacterota bacterium]|nr:GerMN domain-containing protein [Candidatus Paceibacterota bacterium]
MFKRGLTGTVIAAIIAVLALAVVAFVALRPAQNGSLTNDTATTTDGGIVINNGTQTEGDVKTYSQTFQTGFEGENTKVTYQLAYPADSFTVSGNQATISIKETATGKTHTVTILNNSGAGFMSSQEAFEGTDAKGFCSGCASASAGMSFKAGTDVKAWANADKEVIVFKHAPGFVIAKLYKPSAAVKDVLKTLSISTSNTGQGTANTMPVTVYFQNNAISSVADDCRNVVAVTRQVPKSSATANAALTALLAGPRADEKADGYTSAIPAGSKLNSVKIVGTTAYADFNATTESGGGSCSMMARTAQIEKTLLEFPTIKTVVLTANGKSADLSFQP